MPSTPAVVLVRPQLGENIGAVARAMSNFGLSDLRLVAPKNGWPNQRAWDMATGGAPILDKAGLFDTLPEALHDITLVLATTARRRDMDMRLLLPGEAARELKNHGKKTALMFGPERTGLANEDLMLADGIITIPTDDANPSLNLSQSAVIMGYEWHKEVVRCALPVGHKAKNAKRATKNEIQSFFDQLEEYLDAVGHFRTADKKPLMWQNLRTIFTRATLSEQEVRTLRGVIRALYLRRKTPS